MQNRLRFLRTQRNWSQAELAKILGVSRQTINAIEVGKYDPSLSLAFKIAQIFRCPLPFIFLTEERSMFERFTAKAYRAIVLAQGEGERLGHQFVGTEQILIGLIAEGNGLAAKVLKSFDINLETVQTEVEKIIGRGTGIQGVEYPFTPKGKQVLDFAIEESLRLGHTFIGTEHLLLGVLGVTDGVAVRVLEKLDVNLQNLWQEVLREITSLNIPSATIIPSRNFSHEDELSDSPPDFTSGEISARFCAFLFSWVEPRQLGHIIGSKGGFQLPNGEIVAPRISFFSRERLKRVPRTYPELVPDLVVEIKSAFDRLASVQQTIQRFLDLGVRIALLIDPDAQTVSVYRPSSKVTVLGNSEKLTVSDLFPEWELLVSELWPPMFD
ncbi:MAG: Clp protease N-terminal domain-containing protein [Nostoc sp.]|uniref:Clp protease N-terminal domain-containing protein n=1 Tax=Nostoc sp. NMS9 TaxID=2815393 RepID=UPI0025D081A8|nr:Clp protease N-terminal domain-containing protein [Nostoc sp. NMS9]MBN3940215.1 Uma2 family endonuclease [Nostoc sp. NMS9]